jgi:glucose-1-phosphate adenylyltransferase
MYDAPRTEDRPGNQEADGLQGTRLVRNTLAIILAGGRGARLGPLTDWRAKPAVPFGGAFRIIDFALSNCVNSGIRRVGICTQYKAQSLIRHVQRGWAFLDGRFNEFVDLLPAQQRVTADWYKGTADAVFQNLDILRQQAPDHVLVLAGDHVYKMDYAKLLADHVVKRADITIPCMEVPLADASTFGVVSVDERDRILTFQEKPTRPMPIPGRDDVALASMGIYVFNAPFLYEQLIGDAREHASTHDFGRNVIPSLVKDGSRVYAHRFADSCVNGTDCLPYWRDVGTIDAYWAANLDLVSVTPDLNLYDRDWPIWTYQEQLPPAKFVFDDDSRRGVAIDSLVAAGCIVSGATIRRSLLFSSVHVHSFATIEDSVILPNVDVGRGVAMRRTVVEKYCKLPPHLRVGFDAEEDRKRFFVTPRGTTLVTPEMLGQQVHHLR